MRNLIGLLATLAVIAPLSAMAEGKMAEARLGKSIAERKISDETTSFAVGDKAYLWVKVDGATGETLTVTWKVNEQSYPVTLSVGGSPWRTWASKTVHVAGDWTVTVTDASGATLHESKLTVK